MIISLVRDGVGVGQGSRVGETWCIVKIKPMGFPNGLYLKCEKEASRKTHFF